jgi:hypothetical protein
VEILSNCKSNDLEGVTATESEWNSCYVDVDKNNEVRRQSQTKAEPFNRHKTMGDRLELPNGHPGSGRRFDDLPKTFIQVLRGKSARVSEESIKLTGIEEIPGYESTPPELDLLTSHDPEKLSSVTIEESRPKKIYGAMSQEGVYPVTECMRKRRPIEGTLASLALGKFSSRKNSDKPKEPSCCDGPFKDSEKSDFYAKYSKIFIGQYHDCISKIIKELTASQKTLFGPRHEETLHDMASRGQRKLLFL